MRVPEVLEDENWRGKATECVQSANNRSLRYKVVSEFSLTNTEVEHYTRVAELLNTDVNSLVTFSFSEQYDVECFMDVVNFIYSSKSSDDDIEITFINKYINKFKRQLLDKQN